MATQIPHPHRHIYEVINPEQYKEVRHYIIKEISGERVLTQLLNVSKDRNFSNARNISYWLKGKENEQSKWSRPITGLKPTSTPNVFFGDIPTIQNGRHKPTHLLIFKFSKDAEKLIIDVYSDFYTENRAELHKFINQS